MFKLGSTRVRIDYRVTKSAGWIYVTGQIVNVSFLFFLSESTKCGESVTQDTAELFKQCIGDTSINRYR